VTESRARDTLPGVRIAAAALLLFVACSSSKPSGKTVRVAAASDLTKAFEEVGREFETKTGIKPDFTFGSSGLLAKQIEQGAPFFVFAAANREFVDQVVKSGRCEAASIRQYARGHLVVWTRNGIAAPVKLADLADERFKRIAIANPAHAPYGRAAKQALEKVDVWAKVADRMVLAENVQAAMRYAQQGEVDAAVVALSLAVVTDGGAFLRIDETLHDPLDQALVVCGNGEEADAARQLVTFIGSREGREIMTRYGFLLPDEPPRK
jgi:molybdate transport system substrate-binding protein